MLGYEERAGEASHQRFFWAAKRRVLSSLSSLPLTSLCPLSLPPALSIFAAATRVYVNNLPWSTTDDDLRAVFAPAGTVTRVDLYRYRDGRSKVRSRDQWAKARAEAEEELVPHHKQPMFAR